MTRRRIVLCAIAALFAVSAGSATAQNYPDRPIRLIVPFPPGGPTDFMARLIGQSLAMSVGQTILDNRPGAGGTIAAKMVAAADPDGYTLLYGTSGTIGIAPALYKNAGYDPVKSFAPIALVSLVPNILAVAPSVPAQTLGEFIAYAKANPGKLNFGAGLGTTPHLIGELFKAMTKTDIVFIPYKGAAQAMTDLLAGQNHMAVESATTLMPQIETGKVRPLAVMTPQRLPVLPNVPTMNELGYSGFPPAAWTGVLAPADTPPAIVARLNGAINASLQLPEMKANFARFNAQAQVGAAADFAAFIAAEAPSWAAMVKASGAKVD